MFEITQTALRFGAIELIVLVIAGIVAIKILKS